MAPGPPTVPLRDDEDGRAPTYVRYRVGSVSTKWVKFYLTVPPGKPLTFSVSGVKGGKRG